jgi:hypothetical protein
MRTLYFVASFGSMEERLLGVSKIAMWFTWRLRMTPFFSIRIRISSLTNIDSILPTD